MRCRPSIAVLVAFLACACSPSPEPTPASREVALVTEVPGGHFATPPVPTPPVVQSYANDALPANARKYQRILTGAAHELWGLDAPIAVFGAQVHQESGWNEDARSPVGAIGLAQFMPSTADWIDDVYPKELGPAQPSNPTWALRALVRYDKYLWDKVATPSGCDRMAFSLSGYNGGLGWVYKDQKVAKDKGMDPLLYWGVVEKVNAGRNAAAWQENRGYPQRIIKTLQPRYASWGPMVCSK